MDFLLGLIIAAATSLEGLAVAILIAAAMVIFSAFNATIAFAAGYIVFCIATWLLYVIIICNTNNRFMIIASLAVSLALGYLAADAVYKSEHAKDAEREVQKQQNMTQQDKVYYIQRSLMFGGLCERRRNIRARLRLRSMSFMKRSRLKKRAEDKI